jgi:hypothetical protein
MKKALIYFLKSFERRKARENIRFFHNSFNNIFILFASLSGGDSLFDSNDKLGTCRTEADGSFYLTGSEWEIEGIEPYIVVKACRTDDPSICSVENLVIVENRRIVMVKKNSDIFLENDFCSQICKDRVCQSA